MNVCHFDVCCVTNQQLNKRQLRRSKSLMSVLWGGGGGEDDDFGKAKNIRQTELLVDLREAILQVARHFQSLDPKNSKVVSDAKILSDGFNEFYTTKCRSFCALSPFCDRFNECLTPIKYRSSFCAVSTEKLGYNVPPCYYVSHCCYSHSQTDSWPFLDVVQLSVLLSFLFCLALRNLIFIIIIHISMLSRYFNCLVLVFFIIFLFQIQLT